jgi:predicted amidohydrolase
MSSFPLAIASTRSLPGAVEENVKQIIAFAHRAAQDGAHFLLTPEQSASGAGAYPEIIATAEVAGEGKIYRKLAQAARDTGVVLSAGFSERAGDAVYLAHYVVYPDGRFVVQRKHNLNNSEAGFTRAAPLRSAPDEDGHGQPQELHFEIFEVNGVKCAITICADCGIDDIRPILASRGAQVLLLPTAAGGKRADRVTSKELSTPQGREKYMRVLEKVFFPGTTIIEMMELKMAWAAVNMIGHDGRDLYHAGHGMIGNALGEILAFFPGQPNLDRQRTQYAYAEINLDDHL